jgi:hypothetical protein
MTPAAAPDPRLFHAIQQMLRIYPPRREEQQNPELLIETIELYMALLADLPTEEAIEAIHACMRTVREYRPTPAAIIEMHARTFLRQQTGGVLSAELAWTRVQKQIRSVGYRTGQIYHNGQWSDPPQPVFDDPITRAVVETMTWKEICLGKPSDTREQFMWAYRNITTEVAGAIQRADGTTHPALRTGSSPLSHISALDAPRPKTANE